MPNYKLGKKPAVHNPKALRLANYLTGSLPNIPPALNWGAQVPTWPMYDNDTLGDCTIAAAAHMEGLWSYKESAKESIATDAEIVTAYSAVSGYVPGDENTDNGADMNTVLAYWSRVGIAGNTIYGSVACAPRNKTHVRAATYLFGGCYIGIQLPITAQAQSTVNGCWSVVPDWETNQNAQPGSWGGHCVNIIGYNANTLALITWGMKMYMTWNWWNIYCDESFAVLSPQWAPGGAAVAPDHLNLAQLQLDMDQVKD